MAYFVHEKKIEILAVLATTKKTILVTVCSKDDAFFVKVSRKEAIKLIHEAHEGTFYMNVRVSSLYIHAN